MILTWPAVLPINFVRRASQFSYHSKPLAIDKENYYEGRETGLGGPIGGLLLVTSIGKMHRNAVTVNADEVRGERQVLFR